MNNFYDRLSSDYDQMTNAQKRMSREQPFFQHLLSRYHFITALDIGCGTGQSMRILAELGITVSGMDPSEEMLSVARQNLKDFESRTHLLQGDFLSLPDRLSDPVDAVFCLGNTLPHLLSQEDMLAGLANIRNITKSGGIFVLQLLNYHKILSEKKRIVTITRSESRIFIRFYDFLDPFVRFNILILEEQENSFQHKLYSTELYPWEDTDILLALKHCGYTEIELYGDIAFNPFIPDMSDNVVMIVKRN